MPCDAAVVVAFWTMEPSIVVLCVPYVAAMAHGRGGGGEVDIVAQGRCIRRAVWRVVVPGLN